MNGIFLLDKSINISSNAALQRVKCLFQVKKAGHTGSLDPLATGMLPICLGEATKFSQYLLDADKTYSVTMQLGVRTTTSDSEGDIVATRDVPAFTIADIDRSFDFFRGTTLQIPPMFSALKCNGVPLYEYARKGITVERASRAMTISQLIVQSVENNAVNFVVHCSKGTYIRTLVDDVGEKLGCGAHVTRLRRLTTGPFLENQMMTIEKLLSLMQQNNFAPESVLLPMDSALNHFPKLYLSADETMRIQQGKIIVITSRECVGVVRLFNADNQFMGVGEVLSDKKVMSKRLVSIATK